MIDFHKFTSFVQNPFQGVNYTMSLTHIRPLAVNHFHGNQWSINIFKKASHLRHVYQ